MTQESQQPHKRRVRYKGKYPKKFEEKYKELQPEKYQDAVMDSEETETVDKNASRRNVCI